MLYDIAIIASIIAISIAVLMLASIINEKRQVKNGLNGDYGDETKWALELIENEDDELFALAVTQLSSMEMKEAGIVAESKQELREQVVERFEEQRTDPIPEDFAQ